MARACIFCSGKPVTREDAWPRWLNGALPNVGSPWVAVRHSTAREGKTTGGAWVTGIEFNTTVRAVCRNCNNGWMSALENRTKQVLQPMIGGEAISPTPPDQILLATWAVKTAMVFEFANSGGLRVFTTESRRFLTNEDRPPLDARVRLASVSGKAVLECRRWNASKPADDNRLGVSVGLRLGYVALNVIYAPGASGEIPGLEIQESRTDRYIPLYPPCLRTEKFPTLNPLKDDDDFDSFVREPFVDMNAHDKESVIRAEGNLRRAIAEAAPRFGQPPA